MLRKPARWAWTRGLIAPEWRHFTDDLVGLWPLWDQQGTLAVNVANRRLNGTFGVGVRLPAWTTTTLGPAVQFNGNDYITIGEQPETQITGSLTLMATVIFDSLPATVNGLISMGQSNDTEADNYLGYLAILNTKKLRMFWEHGGGTNVVVDSSVAANINAGEIHDYGVTREVGATSTTTFYVDGVPLGTPTTGSTNPTGGTDTSLFLGSTRNNNEFLTGSMLVASMHKRALGAGEIFLYSRDSFGPLRMVDEVGTVVGLPAPPAGGRIMSSLANAGGLAGYGGIVGIGGGLAA